VDLTVQHLTMDHPAAPTPAAPPDPAAMALPAKLPRPRPRPQPEPGPDAGSALDAGPDASTDAGTVAEDGGTTVAMEGADAGPGPDASVALSPSDAGPALAAADAGPNLRGQSEGLTASLPAFVRVAVVVQAERLRDSPHAGASRRILRKAMGLPAESDPIADLEELVVVTQNPLDPRSTASAARASKEARDRPDAGTPSGFAEGDAGVLRRGRGGKQAEKLPPNAGVWRRQLLAIAHPAEGERPLVAMLAMDLEAFTDPDRMGPPPSRIELQAWDLPAGGARAEATAHYASEGRVLEADRFWGERLRWARTSPWIALLGLKPLADRVTLVRTGTSLRATVSAESRDVRAALALLETAFGRRRRVEVDAGADQSGLTARPRSLPP